jgi:flagellin
MRELANQAANDTNTTADRQAIQTETNALIEQLNNIGDTTEFNTKKLLNGGAGVAVSSLNNVAQNIQGTADTAAGSITLTSANTTLATQAKVTGGSAAIKAETDAGQNFNAASTISIDGTAYSFATTDTIQDALDAINADTHLMV